MTTYDKYITTMKILKRNGYVEKASLQAVRNAMLEAGISVRENYQMKFHMQNLSSLGLLKDTSANNVFTLHFSRVEDYENKKQSVL